MMFFSSNSINLSDHKTTRKKGILLPCLSVSLVGFIFVMMICVKYYYDVKSLEEKFSANAEANAATVANTLSIRFNHLYQGLHTIAHLQSIRTIYDNADKPDQQQIHNIQQIYNLLYSSIQISEIYIIPANFDPTRTDPLTGQHQEPTLSFDNNIVGKNAHEESSLMPIAEIETYEYLELKAHMEQLRRDYPTIFESTIAGYPAIISKEVLICDNSKFTLADPDDSNRSGLTYSVPFYNNEGNIAGAVVGVFLTQVLKNLLPNSYYTIHNTTNNFQTTGESEGSNNPFDSISPDNNYSGEFFTHRIKLDIPDIAGNLNLDLKIPGSVFNNQEQIKSTRFFTLVILLSTVLLTISIAFIVALQIRQRRFIEDQNTVLENNIAQRTAELQESETRATAVLNNAADGIIILNADYKIEIINTAAEAIFQYTAEEVTGKHISILGKVLENVFLENITHQDGKNRNKKFVVLKEIICSKKDNSDFPMEINTSKHLHGNNRIYAGIFRDISARKKADQAVTLAREEAEQATKAKSEFLANMSHELRTPLNAILGYCEIMQDDDSLNHNEQYINDLGHIHEAGKNLLHHVDSILDLSRIEAGKMELHLEQFDSNQLISGVVETIQPLIQKNNNTISTSFLNKQSIMDADKLKIQQIILNLLSNACKFTHNGNITITTKCTEKFGIEWLNLTVSDTGIGMSNTQLLHIFNKFTQADSSTTKRFGGTGLGLSISQHFCEMMGGSIRARSEPDSGTEFIVTLPMSVIGPKVDPVAVRFQDATCPQFIVRRKISRVLVISNNPLSKDLTERFLTREGFFTDTVSSTSQALDLIKENVPDVIVIDENSLNFDSWGSIHELKTRPEMVDVSIIMLTKSDSKQLTEAIGATDYLQKPVQRNQLIEIITKYTRQNSPESEHQNHVLIIDNHAGNRMLLKRMLEKEYIHVEVAEHGQEGLDKISNAIPSLIFLDVVMPVMDGFEFVKKLRANKQWSRIPVITITGHDLSHEEKERLSCYVDTMLDKKDLEPAIILEKMRAALIKHLRKDNNLEQTS